MSLTKDRFDQIKAEIESSDFSVKVSIPSVTIWKNILIQLSLHLKDFYPIMEEVSSILIDKNKESLFEACIASGSFGEEDFIQFNAYKDGMKMGEELHKEKSKLVKDFNYSWLVFFLKGENEKFVSIFFRDGGKSINVTRVYEKMKEISFDLKTIEELIENNITYYAYL